MFSVPGNPCRSELALTEEGTRARVVATGEMGRADDHHPSGDLHIGERPSSAGLILADKGPRLRIVAGDHTMGVQDGDHIPVATDRDHTARGLNLPEKGPGRSLQAVHDGRTFHHRDHVTGQGTGSGEKQDGEEADHSRQPL